MPEITIAEAQKLAGFSGPQQVHGLIKKYELHKVKKKVDIGNGKTATRTLVDKSAFEEALTKHKAGAAARKSSTSSGKSKKSKRSPYFKDDSPGVEELGLKPFEKDPRVMAWNKGAWRGWCFAAVTEADGEMATMITSYGKEYSWMSATLLKKIATSEAFFLDPEEAIRFIAAQLLTVKGNHPGFSDIVLELNSIAERLKKIRNQHQAASADAEVSS